MIDWPVVLSALALLPVVALLYFVGCGHLMVAEDDPGDPGTGAGGTGTGGTPPPPTPPIVTLPLPPPTLPAPILTLLTLKPGPTLNVIPTGAQNDKVESVLVSWTLTTKPGQPPADDLPLDETIVRVDGPPRLFLDPSLDPPGTRILADDQKTRYGSVRWTATVITKAAVGGGGRPDFVTPVSTADFSVDSENVFRLDPDWTNPTASPRRFQLVAEPTAPGPPRPKLVTRLQLNPSADINTIVSGGRAYKVVSIKVEWTLSKSTGGRPNQVLHETIVRSDSTRPFLDPKLDQAAMWDLWPDPDPTTGFNQVTCGCLVTSAPVSGGGGPETSPLVVSSPVLFKAGLPNVFVLQPDWSNPGKAPRQFKVVLQA